MTDKNVLADRCFEVSKLTQAALDWVNRAENAETVGPKHKSLTKLLRRSARRAERLGKSAR
ncbi:MAG: virulence factor SrfC family protein, partial [Roseobacter sp.]